jgi:3-hydroxybutyryl-CoA dehydratase
VDCEVGEQASREVTVDADMGPSLRGVTGDYNPLHFDVGARHARAFQRLMAQSRITTGLLHALVAMDLPGPGSLFVR